MGLDELKDEIMKKAHAQSQSMQDDANREADTIVSAAREEASAAVEKARREAQGMASDEADERVAAARLEAKKIIAEGREDAIEKAMDLVWHEVAAQKKSKKYPQLLRSLVKSGAREIGRQDYVVKVNADDRKLLPDMKAKISGAPIKCAGGAVIETSDHLVRVDNTLESIFASKKEQIRKELYREMFGKA